MAACVCLLNVSLGRFQALIWLWFALEAVAMVYPGLGVASSALTDTSPAHLRPGMFRTNSTNYILSFLLPPRPLLKYCSSPKPKNKF